MKKLAGMIVFIALITLTTGCEKKGENNINDKSKSYECYLETEKDEYRRIEHIVSLDEKNKIVTYNIIDNGSYTDKEAYEKVCAEKEEIEKRIEENKYENIQFGNSCTEDALTVNSNMFFDYTHLTEEELKEVEELKRHEEKNGKFNQKAWMLEKEKEGYTCQ